MVVKKICTLSFSSSITFDLIKQNNATVALILNIISIQAFNSLYKLATAYYYIKSFLTYTLLNHAKKDRKEHESHIPIY